MSQSRYSCIVETTNEGRAVAGNNHMMRGTCTKSLHLILGQHNE